MLLGPVIGDDPVAGSHQRHGCAPFDRWGLEFDPAVVADVIGEERTLNARSRLRSRNEEVQHIGHDRAAEVPERDGRRGDLDPLAGRRVEGCAVNERIFGSYGAVRVRGTRLTAAAEHEDALPRPERVRVTSGAERRLREGQPTVGLRPSRSGRHRLGVREATGRDQPEDAQGEGRPA